jgi:hypothetical protein
MTFVTKYQISAILCNLRYNFVGAGDGMVTEIMSKYYNKTDTTEVSSTMVRRLQEKEFK